MRDSSPADPRLVRTAIRIGHHKTEKAALDAALKQYIRRQKRIEAAIQRMGTVEFDPAYDAKASRRRGH